MRRRDRIQEWFADRAVWVQYPNVKMVSTPQRRRPFFRYQMPTSTRITLALLSLMGLAIMLPALIAAGFFLYAFLGAAFGWLPKT